MFSFIKDVLTSIMFGANQADAVKSAAPVTEALKGKVAKNVDPSKVHTLHFNIHETWMTETGKIALSGGHLAPESTEGAFLAAWPGAVDGVVGAGILRNADDPTSAFYADLSADRGNLRFIRVSSGCFNREMAKLYAYVGKTLSQNGSKRAQLVVTAIIERGTRNAHDFNSLDDVELYDFTVGGRSGLRAVINKYVFKTYVGAHVVFEGEEGYLDNMVVPDHENCVSDAHIVAPRKRTAKPKALKPAAPVRTMEEILAGLDAKVVQADKEARKLEKAQRAEAKKNNHKPVEKIEQAEDADVVDFDDNDGNLPVSAI